MFIANTTNDPVTYTTEPDQGSGRLGVHEISKTPGISLPETRVSFFKEDGTLLAKSSPIVSAGYLVVLDTNGGVHEGATFATAKVTIP